MKRFYRVMRFLAVIFISMLVIIPACLYVALSVTPVQRRIADICEREISQAIGCEVVIGGLGIMPFNRVVLRDVKVITSPGDTAIVARRIGAGLRLLSLAPNEPITINYAELIGLDARLRRDSIGAPLNIQPIIDALSKKDENKEPTLFDLKINTVILRSTSISYDVLSEPRREGLDMNHLGVHDLQGDMQLPRLKNNDFVVNIKRMGFVENNGLVLTNLASEITVSDSILALENFNLSLPSSRIAIENTEVEIDGLKNLGNLLNTANIRLAMTPDSYLSPGDFAPLLPKLKAIDGKLVFKKFVVEGNMAGARFVAELKYDEAVTLAMSAIGSKLASVDRAIDLRRFELDFDGGQLAKLLSGLEVRTPITQKLPALGEVNLNLKGNSEGSKYSGEGMLVADLGKINLKGRADVKGDGCFSASADVATIGALNLLPFTQENGLTALDAELSVGVNKRGRLIEGSADALVRSLTFNHNQINDITLLATLDDGVVDWAVRADDKDVALNIEGLFANNRDSKQFKAKGSIERFTASQFGVFTKYGDNNLSANIDVSLMGETFKRMLGHAALTDMTLSTADHGNLSLKGVQARFDEEQITIKSDYLNGFLKGDYNLLQLPQTAKQLASGLFPSLIVKDVATGKKKNTQQRKVEGDAHVNDFALQLTISETEKIAKFFNLPISVIYPVEINALVNEPESIISLDVNAPYLRQGNKLIENTRVTAEIDDAHDCAFADATTTMPTQRGPMMMNLGLRARDDAFSTDVNWRIDRKALYEGHVSAQTSFSRNEHDQIVTDVHINPSSMTFNDSVWVVNPANIRLNGLRDIGINGLDVSQGNHYVKIGGRLSDNPLDRVTLDLSNFDLDYLFEALGIDKVKIGGDATGTFYASDVFSGAPHLETSGLFVKNISYNRAVIGDAIIKSYWEGENKSIMFDAAVDQEFGRKSYIKGFIKPMTEELNIRFDCDHVNAAFLGAYMDAFASDVKGEASGWARIFGTFKDVDLEGDVKADNFSLKVNFTNTTYVTSDSVRMRPGLIDMNNVTIRDKEGHTARLNGWVKHECFRNPSFDFGITEANNFLSYNETAKDNPVWHGRIYGNGSAFVKGWPGVVNINVDMATAPKSKFAFVLSDMQVADEYSFLTFRDKKQMMAQLTDTITERDNSMDLVNELKARMKAATDDSPSEYNISLQIRVTPEAQITLVMDPIQGDRIRAYGSGHLRMDYGSANNDLKMYGTYTLDRGDYNFTLQDIIIKDFDIRAGSEIKFNGDPYGAVLDIIATYSLNANLSDLDESFLQDKDLNRTSVPVNALLKLQGDIRRPEISFDLEFPTLTTDVYRKVRSIISTDDMMNQQIIYLLALSRFYTPEYMASTTKGNELVSVASSTISSQLRSMLGQIADNWNIAPSFRSDRGDFSDVEVNVALSSRLLNNRLLLNGNFGYRDKALNTSQFIGDFDLEYLLDRSGKWRLKAYNRFNDQNYYLRTAQTTQGVGVVLRQDFDSFTSFMRGFRKKSKQNETNVATGETATKDDDGAHHATDGKSPSSGVK